jgi:hypothetical protein
MDSWDEKRKWTVGTRKSKWTDGTRKGNGQLGRENEMDSWDEKRKWTAATRKGTRRLDHEKELL